MGDNPVSMIDPSGMQSNSFSSSPNSHDIEFHYTDPTVGAGWSLAGNRAW